MIKLLKSCLLVFVASGFIGCMPKGPEIKSSPKVIETKANSPTPPHANTGAEAEKVVIRAIQAIGGENFARKLLSNYTQAEGVEFIEGKPQNCVWKTWVALPDRLRYSVVYNNGSTASSGIIGETGWVKMNQAQTMDLDPVSLKSIKEMMYVNQLMCLTPLRESRISLTLLETQKVDGGPCDVVRAKREGWPDVTFHFSKDSGMLVMAAHDFLEPNRLEKLKKEIYLSQYKEMYGGKLFHKLIVNINGNKYIEQNITKWELFDRVNESDFARP